MKDIVSTFNGKSVKYPGIVIQLGGEDFIVPPLALKHLVEHKELIARNRAPQEGVEFYDIMRESIPLIHAALTRNYPDMTLDKVGEMVDVLSFRSVIDEIFGVSGIISRVAAASKELAAASGAGQGEVVTLTESTVPSKT